MDQIGGSPRRRRARRDEIQYYVRASTYNFDAMQQCLQRYSAQFPADIEWTFNVRENFQELIREGERRVVAERRTGENVQFNLLYFGITLATEPENRLADDLYQYTYTRLTNWNAANGADTQWRIYALRNIHVNVQNVNAILEHETAGLLESILITASGNVTLNWAKGGLAINLASGSRPPNVVFDCLEPRVATSA